MKICHVIFDWSGTLYDDHRVSYLSTRATIRHFSKSDISFADYKKYFTLPAEKFYRRYISKIPFSEINLYYFNAFSEHAHRGKLFARVKELLRACRQKKISVSILSTVRQDLLVSVLQKTGILGEFSQVQGSVIDKRQALRGHLRSLHLRADQTVFIGDTDHDVEAANQHGLISACVLSGYQSPDKLLSQKPRLAFTNLSDMVPLIKWQGKILPIKTPPERPLATVGALVLNPRGEVLLVLTHKWSLTYGIPGGKIDRGETALAALKREMYEETGLKIRPGKLLMTQDCIDSQEFYIPKSHMLLMNWVARVSSSRVKLNNEALSYIWIKPDLALHLKLNEPTRQLLQHRRK